ncbi:MAG: winged helix DNA-binding domain-containing protein [Faecousia sp.]
MTAEEIKLRQLAGQHLLFPTDTQAAVKDLCGVQAQYFSHALHGLAIRCGEVHLDGLVKSWTNRGTMHIFSAEDLPLFLHKGRTHFLRPVDTLETDAYITAERKSYFAEMIVSAIAQGMDQREDLKVLCQKSGMTEVESKSLFDPWGGTIRALCECGRICHKVQEKKAFQLCPSFEPMEETPARLELARRYFTHFGPATVKDAAYFFGKTQAQVKSWLAQLPVSETQLDGKSYFYIGSKTQCTGEVPPCLFLAGFDQLMLGYKKTESLYLRPDKLREIFSLSGIVRPAVLVHGQVVGWWNRKNRKVKITLFAQADHRMIAQAAEALWEDLAELQFE